MSYKNIDVKEFQEKITTQTDAIILDVRSEAELGEGFIPRHIMIDINQADFMQKIEDLDKSKTYLVYCRSGARSERACMVMQQAGFDNLFNLKGGIQAWNKANA